MSREIEDLVIERWVSAEDQSLVVRWMRVVNESRMLWICRGRMAYVAELETQRWASSDGNVILCGYGGEPSSAIRCGVGSSRPVLRL